MKKNIKGLRFSICCLAFIFFVFPAGGFARLSFDDSAFIQTSQNAKRIQSKKKKGTLKNISNQTKTVAVPPGNWGATGVNLIIEETGARIEYDCADAAITQKFVADKQGGFNLKGVYTRRYPGARRVNLVPKSQNARFEGKISGDKMTLKVRLAETKETLEEVVLERGKTGRIHKCY